MIKKFDTNDEYFKWFDKNKGQVTIKHIKAKSKIIVLYEKKRREVC